MENLTEKETRRIILRAAIFYGLILILANFMGSQIPSVWASERISTVSMTEWVNFLEQNNFFLSILTVLCFLFPSILCLSYVRTKDIKKLKARFVGLPGIYSFLGTTGWILYFIFEIIFLNIFKFSSHENLSIKNLVLQSLLFVVLETIFTFVLSYFFIESVHRTYFLPKIFPEGKVSEVKGGIKPIMWLMFIIFYIAVALFPVIYILCDDFAVRYNNHIPFDINMIIVSALLIISGIVVTIIFQRLITSPIKKLTQSAKNITQGDYSKKTGIVSNDEFGILSDTFNEMTKSLKEKEFMRDTFGKVVDPYVRDYLMKGNVALGGESRVISVMFCDIRSFTAMSESMEPSAVVKLLNEYFTVLGKCISNNHGIINKYIGDAIMAIFGAPVKTDNHANDAYNAAIEMQAALIELNKNFKNRNMPEIRFGIGIHSGAVLAGNIGAENRMEYTVIGDTVNTASRIESLCKEYKTDLLISENTLKLLKKDSSNFQFVDEACIRGKEEKVKLFTRN